MIDEQKLRELADAAEKDGAHVYTNPRDSNKWQDNEAWVNVASPAVVSALLDELATLRSERTAWRMTAENAGAAVKQARIDALEEAKKAVDEETLTDPQDNSDDAYNNAVYDCLQAIKSLKGKTP